MRPGPPPPPRARRRPLGPTPRYQYIPRWGLADQIAPSVPHAERTRVRRASATAVRATLLAATAIFALAALVHIGRYLLLLINRTILLSPWIATPALWIGVLVSLAAIAAVFVTAVVLTSWLIDRRATVFAYYNPALRDRPDPRPEWSLWAGCLIPVVNLVWAPVFVIELAHAEQSQARQRGPILVWWIAWVVSTAVSGWAIWTSSASEPQAVADNTVTVIIAYAAGMASLLLLWRVFEGFVRMPAGRSLHRWVIVPEDRRAEVSPEEGLAIESGQSPSAVESERREPAA